MIDVNAFIGPYPFRYVPHPDPEVLVRVLVGNNYVIQGGSDGLEVILLNLDSRGAPAVRAFVVQRSAD